MARELAAEPVLPILGVKIFAMGHTPATCWLGVEHYETVVTNRSAAAGLALADCCAIGFTCLIAPLYTE